MIKKHLKVLVIASIIVLLPVVFGVVMWDQLPDPMPAHWSLEGEVDGWVSKPFAVFGMPLILLVVEWICLLGTAADPKKDRHPEKVLHLVLWIIPALSLLLHTVTYVTALGNSVPVEIVMPVFMGLMFAIIGNYLPKCKQNYTIGIKIPWTLNSEENWNRTHRFAGRLWVVCGIVIILTGFFGGFWFFFGIALVMVIVPFIYSYMLHRKGV